MTRAGEIRISVSYQFVIKLLWFANQSPSRPAADSCTSSGFLWSLYYGSSMFLLMVIIIINIIQRSNATLIVSRATSSWVSQLMTNDMFLVHFQKHRWFWSSIQKDYGSSVPRNFPLNILKGLATAWVMETVILRSIAFE